MLKNFNIAQAESARPAAGLESVELTLRLIELLASASCAKGVTEVAGDLGISKPRAHRHLRCLVDLGYARQDPYTEGYEIGARVLALGNAAQNYVTVLEMIAGANPLDFSVKPGARLEFDRSAHGLVALAFGPRDLLAAQLEMHGAEILESRVSAVRTAGWTTSIDSVEYWANALAAPVFDAKGLWRGSIAIAGASGELPAQPGPQQLAWITSAAKGASHLLGWSGGRI